MMKKSWSGCMKKWQSDARNRGNKNFLQRG